MKRAELSEQNYRKISWINIMMVPPLLILFAWPYLMLGVRINMPDHLLYPGSFCFSFPFTLTILHGHVTMALGAMHRAHYHEWLARHNWSFGFLIRPVFFSTRFRLTFVILSFVILALGLISLVTSGENY